jgi:hypothetical protein
MSDQGRDRILRFGMAAAIAAILLAALCLGCGSGGSAGSTTGGGDQGTGTTAEPASPASCEVGASALPLIPDAPPLWREGPGPTVALACLHDRIAAATIVGFAIPGRGACVSPYDLDARESFGELCEERGTGWVSQCEGSHGCLHFFVTQRGITSLAGPLDAKVKRIEVLVDGKPLPDGTMLARVRGKLERAIGSSEPFGYFAVFVRGCVVPSEVKIELSGADGSSLGNARPWDVAVPPCP